VLVAVLLAAGACTGDEAADPAPETPSAEPVPEVQLTTRVGVVTGKLEPVRRKALAGRVGGVVDAWFDAAYLEGDYPRTDFGSFPGFTPGASRRARFDRDLTSNADIGARVDSVTPLMRKARLDVLAVGRRARSVTARFDLRMRVVLFDEGAGEGSAEQATRTRRLQARGRVFLTHRPAGWRIFGYDVTKGWLS
jgi:hypothetical protein